MLKFIIRTEQMQGELRPLQLRDRWYVVGNNSLMPVKDFDEAKKIIAEMTLKPIKKPEIIKQRTVLKKVEKVYSGKDKMCCCGCSGKYWYRNNVRFPQMLKKVTDIIETANEVDEDNSYIATVVGSRLYILYFKD